MSIINTVAWWSSLDLKRGASLPDGVVRVDEYSFAGRPPDEMAMMERARQYGARAVLFGVQQTGKAVVAQAFIYDDSLPNDQFAKLHKKLWSWGGVPLVYRTSPGAVDLFRCAHKPDFINAEGQLTYCPAKTLTIAAKIASQTAEDPWWDARQIRNGTLWDNPHACKELLSANKSAHRALVSAVKDLSEELNEKGLLPKPLRRKLLILTLLIAYLEQRGVFVDGYFGRFVHNAEQFFQVLRNGPALVALLADLECRFNGNVFTLSDNDRERLATSNQLERFATLVEGRQERNGQLTLWKLYSFRDLPVELISHIYQLFVKDESSSVYTPPFLVRLVLDETLDWKRLDRLHETNEVIIDCACGSGVFLVEAYKRLVLHWRSRNGWKKPTANDLKLLLRKVHGIDLEEAAIELAAFSLCLALCDALEPEEIRSTIKLFPPLAGVTLHHSCFFEAKDKGIIKCQIGAVVGNPPFISKLSTPGAQRAYKRYCGEHRLLPDKQLAYLFLHEAMMLLVPGGVLGMLQSYNFLYNQGSLQFRREFMKQWDVREILDFISVRGLFQKGQADTKVIVVVAEANKAPAERQVLHATFRRTGLVEAEQCFDIDYYDLHWIPRKLIFQTDSVWRANLLGGGRLLGLVNRLKQYPTLGGYAKGRDWNFGEGFIEAIPGARGTDKSRNKLVAAPHITGHPLLTTKVLVSYGIDKNRFETVSTELFKSPYKKARFTAPMTVVHQQFNLSHGFLEEGYVTYKNQIVGFCGPRKDKELVQNVAVYLDKNKKALQAFAAATSIKLFTQHATTLSEVDVIGLPYPPSGDLDLSSNEKVVINDVVEYYRDLVRFADDSLALQRVSDERLNLFAHLFATQLNAVYSRRPLMRVSRQRWPGVVCEAFAFGDGAVRWDTDADLQQHVQRLLYEQKSQALQITRICRLYDSSFIFLLKPDRNRYWLDSIALRDADEVLADLREQGF